MKRLLVLLAIVAGGLAWAAFGVPNNAAVVNGHAISQDELNSDVHAIANSPDYLCYLNTQGVLQGQTQPLVAGGAGQSSSNQPVTTTNAFARGYLDTAILHELIGQVASQHHVVITPQDITVARQGFKNEITALNQQLSQTAQAGDPAYNCNSPQALTGSTVVAHTASTLVDQAVRFNAQLSVLEEDLSGVGSSSSDLQAFFQAHRTEFDTACITVAGYTSASDAQTAKGAVYEGGSFATLAQKSGYGPEGCNILYLTAAQLPASAGLQNLPLNTVSDPVALNGGYFLIEVTSRTPTPFAQAKTAVQQAAQILGQTKARTLITNAQKHAAVTVDPRYGTWRPSANQIVPPVGPPSSDLLNRSVDAPTAPTGASPSGTTPSSGLSG